MQTGRRIRRERRGRYEMDARSAFQGASRQMTFHDGITDQVPAYVGVGACSTYGRLMRSDVLLRQPVRASAAPEVEGPGGVPAAAARRMLIVLSIVLAIAVLRFPLRGLLSQTQTNRQLRAEIVSQTHEVEMRTRRLREASGSVNVRYEAARRGMISAASVKKVKLAVPGPGILYLNAQSDMLEADHLAMAVE